MIGDSTVVGGDVESGESVIGIGVDMYTVVGDAVTGDMVFSAGNPRPLQITY